MDICIMLVTGKVTYLYGADYGNEIGSLGFKDLEVTFLTGYADKEHTLEKRVNVKHICYIEEIKE